MSAVKALDTIDLPINTVGFVLRTLRDAKEKLRQEGYSTTESDLETCIQLIECGSDAEKVNELLDALRGGQPPQVDGIEALERLLGDYISTKGLGRKGDVAA